VVNACTQGMRKFHRFGDMFVTNLADPPVTLKNNQSFYFFNNAGSCLAGSSAGHICSYFARIPLRIQSINCTSFFGIKSNPSRRVVPLFLCIGLWVMLFLYTNTAFLLKTCTGITWLSAALFRGQTHRKIFKRFMSITLCTTHSPSGCSNDQKSLMRVLGKATPYRRIQCGTYFARLRVPCFGFLVFAKSSKRFISPTECASKSAQEIPPQARCQPESVNYTTLFQARLSQLDMFGTFDTQEARL